MITWPAIAIASRVHASSGRHLAAIWWAAMATSPCRAATAVVTKERGLQRKRAHDERGAGHGGGAQPGEIGA